MNASVDSDDLNETVYASKQGSLEIAETEGRDDDLALIGETVGYVVECGVEGEEPGFGIVYRFPEPMATT